MKKFLKVFIIVLLVLSAIGGTAYFFFANLEEENYTTPSIVAMLKSDEKAEFNNKLRTVSSIVNSDSSDQRISLIIETNEKLDEIAFSLSTYFIRNNTEIESKDLSKKYKTLIEEKKLLNKMMDEYLIKKTSTYFDRHIGANDLYYQSSSYLVAYSEFVYILNKIVPVQRSQELKFNMFELYSNVVLSTFKKSNIKLNDSSWMVLVNSSNIAVVNSCLKIKNNNIVKIENEGQANEEVEIINSSNSNLFNTYYEKCNKKTLSTSLAEYIKSATSATQSSNEGYAAYYFKGIYEI